MINIKNKGISIAEILISLMVLSVIMLSLTDFSMNALDVSGKNILQVQNNKESRVIVERIASQINNKADYIFPEAQVISIKPDDDTTINVNTEQKGVFALRPVDAEENYRLIGFYLKQAEDGLYDLYEYNSYDTAYWSASGTSLPMDFVSTFSSGSSVLLLQNIDLSQSNLTYILNNESGITDQILKGAYNGGQVDDKYALIKGFKWELVVSKDKVYNIKIKGFANNVPRSILLKY